MSNRNRDDLVSETLVALLVTGLLLYTGWVIYHAMQGGT